MGTSSNWNAAWGPRPAQAVTPRRRRSKRRWVVSALAVLIGLSLLGSSTLATLIGIGLVLCGGAYLTAPLRRRRRRTRTARFKRQPDARIAAASDPARLLKEVMHDNGAGVFLGLDATDRAWRTASPEHAVLVLGPPRSGKTTA